MYSTRSQTVASTTKNGPKSLLPPSKFSTFLLLTLTFAVTFDLTSASNDLELGLRSNQALAEQEKLFQDYEANYDELEAGEDRFLFSSTNIVVTNSTLIRVIGAIIGALLIGLPLYLAFAAATAGGSSNSGYNSYYRSGRFKREDLDENDLANYMYILTEAFKKHGIESTGCQILVACEAGVDSLTRKDKNTYLKKTNQKYSPMTGLPGKVHRMLSLIPLSLQSETGLQSTTYASHAYLQDLMNAHSIGTEYKSLKACYEKFSNICQKTT